ncbi:MAG: single-stranded DNA-binding protein, partial [Cyanothece sp. SIO2G6]|nr:single-stranded DNA-binding protein [Cyanothece sp. SIO2G6]
SATVTGEPQVRYTTNDQIPVMEIQVEFAGKDNQGQPQQKPLHVTVWNGNVAKVQAMNLAVGQSLLLEGSVAMDKVQTTEGQKRTTAKFWAYKVIPAAADYGLNIVNIAGRLGQEPSDDVKYFESGNMVATNSIAVRRPKKDTEPDWFRCKFWNKTGESIVDHQHKGNTIGVTGRLDIEIFQDRNTGEVRHTPVLVGDRVSFLGSKSNGESHTAPAAPAAVSASVPAPSETNYDDIPF